MQYRLDGDHYIDDMLIPAGTVIGDDSGHISYRYTHDVPDGQGGYFKAGSPRPPGRQMVPLDAEAKELFFKAFGGVPPERDPTKAIPIQGTGDKTKALPPGAPRPGTDNQYKKPLVGPEGTNLFEGDNKAKMEAKAPEPKPQEPIGKTEKKA